MPTIDKTMNLHHLLSGILTAAVLVFMSCGSSLADDDVSLVFLEKDHAYDINGSFFVDAEPSVVWDVLTGYQRLPRFVDNLKKSDVVEDIGPYHFLLEQEFEGGFLFITMRIRVLLDVHETWYKTIQFADVDHKYFEFYQGSWELSPDAQKGLKIVYTLRAKQKFDALFAGDYMRGGVKDLLEAVRREIVRRQVKESKERALLADLKVPTP